IGTLTSSVLSFFFGKKPVEKPRAGYKKNDNGPSKPGKVPPLMVNTGANTNNTSAPQTESQAPQPQQTKTQKNVKVLQTKDVTQTTQNKPVKTTKPRKTRSFANILARRFVIPGIMTLFGLGVMGISLRKILMRKKRKPQWRPATFGSVFKKKKRKLLYI
ncbi:hypothetical protein ACFLYU_01655, partial [Candidatus Dependentiae bacterium]